MQHQLQNICIKTKIKFIETHGRKRYWEEKNNKLINIVSIDLVDIIASQNKNN